MWAGWNDCWAVLTERAVLARPGRDMRKWAVGLLLCKPFVLFLCTDAGIPFDLLFATRRICGNT